MSTFRKSCVTILMFGGAVLLILGHASIAGMCHGAAALTIWWEKL